MKNRNGFVSNSSSSSFVVIVDKNNPKFLMEVEVDLSQYGKTLKTIDELIEHWQDHYYIETAAMLKDEDFIKAKVAIENGKYVIMGNFEDQSGDNLEYILCNYGIPKDLKNVEIIDNTAGY